MNPMKLNDKAIQLDKMLSRCRYKLSLMRIGFIRDFVYGMRNIWDFRKEIWHFRPWDSRYNGVLFARSIEITADNMERNGNEIPETLNPKIEKMKRFVWLVRNYENSIHLAELELGEIERRPYNEWFEPLKDGAYRYIPDKNPHTKKVFNRATELEAEMWNEMWDIIKGTDDSGKYVDTESHGKVFVADGTNMLGWWD